MDIKNEIINKDVLKKVDKILSSAEEIDKWMGYLKENETPFYDWIQKRSSGAISNMSHAIDLRIRDANGIAYTLLCAFLSGYIISHELNSKLLDNLVITPEQEFKSWSDGKLPSCFYNYSLDGLDKTSTKYIAKVAHLKLVNDSKKKQERMKSFFEIKNEVNKQDIDIWENKDR